MIRKWTRIISLPVNFLLMKRMYLKYRYKSFRRSLIYKKLHIKRTKFRRKQYAKLKHLYNWNLCVQIWQNWICDFDWNFYINKFYYFKNFNEFEIISYNSYFFNTKKLKLFSNYLFFINCFFSRKMNFFLNNKNNNFFLSNFFFLPFFSSFLSYPVLPSLNDFSNPMFSLNISSSPILLNLDNFFYKLENYSKLSELSFSFVNFFNFIFSFLLFFIIEYKKIITLFYLNFI